MRLELKICERCGALWFRPESRNWLYCVGCFPIMRMMASPRSQARAPQGEEAGAR